MPKPSRASRTASLVFSELPASQGAITHLLNRFGGPENRQRGFESHPLRQLILNEFLCFQSAQNSKTAQTAKPGYTAGTRAGLILALAPLLSLLMGACGIGSIPCFAQQHAKTFRVPFHDANGLILLDIKVNDNPAVMILDSGASFTLLNANVADADRQKAQQAMHEGRYLTHLVNLKLANHSVAIKAVIADMTKRTQLKIDGLLGEDFLRQFVSVRFDFKNHVVEFEEAQ